MLYFILSSITLSLYIGKSQFNNLSNATLGNATKTLLHLTCGNAICQKLFVLHTVYKILYKIIIYIILLAYKGRWTTTTSS